MAYTTKAKVDNLSGGNIPQGTFDDILASVKAIIDRYCGKTFEGGSSTKIYDGNGLNEIAIDPFYGSPTSVLVLNSDGTTYATLTEGQANDYVSLPLNQSEKNAIRLTGNGFWGRFSKRDYLLSVTASFGVGVTVPKDIELAATKMVANIYTNGQDGGNVRSETLGDYSVSFGSGGEDDISDASILAILDSYRDIDI